MRKAATLHARRRTYNETTGTGDTFDALTEYVTRHGATPSHCTAATSRKMATRMRSAAAAGARAQSSRRPPTAGDQVFAQCAPQQNLMGTEENHEGRIASPGPRRTDTDRAKHPRASLDLEHTVRSMVLRPCSAGGPRGTEYGVVRGAGVDTV